MVTIYLESFYSTKVLWFGLRFEWCEGDPPPRQFDTETRSSPPRATNVSSLSRPAVIRSRSESMNSAESIGFSESTVMLD